MTDEEMAEEYAKSIVIFDRDFHNERFAELKQAFLAGLDAGKDMAEADLATVAYMQGADNQKKKAEKQLTKARDLLNEFMRISTVIDEDFEPDYSELIGETEIFFKEVSE